MSNEEILNKVLKIFEQNGLFFEPNDYDYELNMDSLTYISIIVCIEDEFNIEFDDSDLAMIPNTLRAFVDIIQNTIKNNSIENITI